jgi:hypothetical protein
MKIYIHFNQRPQALLFHEVAKHWQTDFNVDSFAGVTIAKDNDHLDTLRSQREVDYAFIDEVEEIEVEALKHGLDQKRVEHWEKMLDIPLWHLVAADRSIGHQFVKGGKQIKVPYHQHKTEEIGPIIATYWLDFYERRLTEYSPDFVFAPMAAATHALALHHICRFLNIPWYVIAPARIDNLYFVGINNPHGQCSYLEEQIFANIKKGAPRSLNERFRNYYDSFNALETSSTGPSFGNFVYKDIEDIRDISWTKFICRLAKEVVATCVKSISNFKSGRKHLRRKARFSNLRIFLSRQISVRYLKSDNFYEPNTDEPFVFFPLHVEPEKTTMIDATNFTNQLHVIELLAKNVPANHKLYVKEHPYMIGQRPTHFNDKLTKIPNVKIIYPLSSTKNLIARASVVATITGTAGWEGLMMGRPVLVLGECLFSNFPGVVRCTDPDQLASTFKNLIFETKSDADRKTNAHHILRSIQETAFDLKVPWEIFYKNLNKESRGGLGNNPLVTAFTRKMSSEIMRVHCQTRTCKNPST